MNTACVTGASGFIGRALCRELEARGTELVTFCKTETGQRRHREYAANITRPIEPTQIQGVDTVFHLAGKAHALSETMQDESEYSLVNTVGTRNMLAAAKTAGVKRFVLFSTVKAMSNDKRELRDGREPPAPWSELDDIAPDTAYGRSKLEAEKLVLHGGFVSEPVVLRLCMVYGAGAKGNMQKMLQAVSSRRFPPFPDIPNKRSMVHVQDVIQAALLAAEKPRAIGQIYIVSDGHGYQTRQIFEWMCRALDRPCPNWAVPLTVLKGLGAVGDFIGWARRRRFVFDSDALNKLVGSSWYSSRKIESELGFKAQWDLEKSLPEMVSELLLP
jgi:UDP-glucose 4-epimerase